MKYIQETEEWKESRKKSDAELKRKADEVMDRVILEFFCCEKKK